ncbi:MAG: MFS transporter [Actinomycetes bacterium]
MRRGTHNLLSRLLPESPAERAMALATLANTTGNGMFFTVSAIYFTQSVGLSPAQVGLGLTVAGVLGLLAGVPAGHLGDVRGPRNLLIGLAVVEAAGVALYTVVDSFLGFLVAACLVTVVDRSANGVRSGLIAAMGAPGDRVRLRAYLRAVTNVGITVGAPIGGLALAVDTHTAYVVVILLNAATFLVAALLLRRVPEVPARPHTGDGPRLAVLRDRSFVAVTAVHAMLAMHFSLLDVALPLWIARRTDAPKWVIALVLLVNTVTVVLLQVRFSRRVTTPADGARALRRAGLVIALACVVFASAGNVSAGVAVALLLAGALVHVVGELLQSAGGWAVSFGLAPEHQQGQYQGFFSTGFAASSMLAPLVLTTVCVTWGVPGWLLMGALFAVAGLALAPLVARAERDRAPEHATV